MALVEAEGLGDHVGADPVVLEDRGLILTGRLQVVLAEVLPLLEREIILEIDRICNLKSGLFFQPLIRNNLPSHVEQDLLSFFF